MHLLARPLHPHPPHCKHKDGSIYHIVPEELELQVPRKMRWKKQAPLEPKSRFVCQRELCLKKWLVHVSAFFAAKEGFATPKNLPCHTSKHQHWAERLQAPVEITHPKNFEGLFVKLVHPFDLENSEPHLGHLPPPVGEHLGWYYRPTGQPRKQAQLLRAPLAPGRCVFFAGPRNGWWCTKALHHAPIPISDQPHLLDNHPQYEFAQFPLPDVRQWVHHRWLHGICARYGCWWALLVRLGDQPHCYGKVDLGEELRVLPKSSPAHLRRCRLASTIQHISISWSKLKYMNLNVQKKTCDRSQAMAGFENHIMGSW